MASKHFLRRLPLLARAPNQLNSGAFPDVANDVLPIVAGSTEPSSNTRQTGSPIATPVSAVPRTVLKPGVVPQTLGQWNQRLSHLQTLQKPLSTLGIAPGTDASRPPWQALPETGKQTPSPTDIAASTLPSIAGLLKHKLPVSSAAAITFDSQQAATAASAAASPRNTLPEGTAATGTAGAKSAPIPITASPASTDDVLSAAVSVDASTEDSLPLLSTLAAGPQDAAQPPQQQLLQPQYTPTQPHGPRRSSSGRAGSGGAASSSIQLNKHIMGCRNTEELLGLVQHRGGSFDYFNISTALARVPKLAAGSSLPSGLTGAAAAPGGGFRQYSTHLAAAAAAGLPPGAMSSSGAMAAAVAAAESAAAAAAQHASGAGVLPSDLHVDAAGRSLLDHLAQLMVTQINSFDARGLANSAWAFGKLKYVPAGGLPEVIAQAALRRMHEFSPQNLSNLVWSFVYMHHADEALLSAASRLVCARVGEFKPQELANIVWAFASLGHRDDEMLAVVAQQARRIAPLFKEQELSNMLWALGKMSLRGHPEVFEALMAETRAKLPAFLPQGISNVAWALASVGHADMLFLDRVVAQCGGQLGAFDVQALSNLVWAMASLGYYQPHFVAAVVNECLSRGLDRLSPQNLSNILWGCATLNHRDPRMLSAWAAQTLEKLASFEPQGISNTAWAFARLGFHSPQLFQALAAAAAHKLDGFTAQGLSNLAWAMATAGHTQPRLFEALAQHATSLAPSFNAQNCSVTLWAAATLRHYDQRLYDVMLERLVAEVEECEPQNIANALWAVARMGHSLPPESAAPLVRHAVRLLPRMSQQELCNTMWAVASLDLMDDDLFASFCGCLQRLADISPEGMHQAYHAQLMFHSSLARAAGVPLVQLQQLAEANPSAASFLLPRLPEPLHTVAASMWAASARDVHVSRLQQEVSGALAVAGVPHAVEWMTDDQHFSVDIGLQVNSQPTAVEVNGIHHYTSNPPHRALGDMGVRRRLLKDRGWHVVDVGFTDWEAMGRTLAERGNNLVGRIAASLDTWDWRSVGLPLRAPGSSNANIPPPQAVVSPVPKLRHGGVNAAAVAAAAAQPTPSFHQALAAAMGLGPLYPFPSPSQMATGAALPNVDGLTGWSGLSGGGGGLDNTFCLGPQLAGAINAAGNSTTTSTRSSASSVAAAGGGGGGPLGLLGSLLQRASSSLTEEQRNVQAAVEAAEALSAMPGGNLLLARQMYDVLGVQLPAPGVMLGSGGAAAAAAHVSNHNNRTAAAAPQPPPPQVPSVMGQMTALQQEYSLCSGKTPTSVLCPDGGDHDDMVAVMQLMAAQHQDYSLCSGTLPVRLPGPAHFEGDGDDAMMVTDDDLERVVRFALA